MLNNVTHAQDMLAAGSDSLVLMPDFLEGGLPLDIFPPDTPEKQQLVKDFLSTGPGNFKKVVKQVHETAAAVKEAYPSVEKVLGLGLCFGGKVGSYFYRKIILACNGAWLVDSRSRSWSSPRRKALRS